MTRRVQDTNGNWRPVGSIMPTAPAASDPRGATTTFHGRYRGPHNTGVPDKSALGRPRFLPTNLLEGQVISDQHFIGQFDVYVPNVTFQRCFFEGKGALYAINALEPITLIDCDIDGGKSGENAVVVTGSVHAVRCHIWGGGSDSIGFGDGATYEDCYIHGVYSHYGAHSDAAQTLGGTDFALLRSKLMSYYPAAVTMPYAYNSSMQLGIVDGRTLDGLQIIDNFSDGGGYTWNGGLNAPGIISNVYISGNRFGRHYQYGPITAANRVVPPSGTFTRTNVYDDTGRPV